MARQVQIIKGTTEQNDAFTGAEGALTYDTETKNLRIHDGTTEGGFEVPTAAMADYVIYWDSADSADHSHAKPGVSTPTGHGWYRYYKSGWVEQGGVFPNSRDQIVALPIIMQSAIYNINSDLYDGTIGYNALNWSIADITTAGFHIFYDGEQNSPSGFSWTVKGYAA